MATAVTIEEKVPGQPPSQNYVLEISDNQITVRDLIRMYVERQVSQHNIRKSAAEPNMQAAEELLLNPPKEDKRFAQAQCAVEVEKALCAFSSNKFFVLVDGKQVSDLDEEVHLTVNGKVTFLKLVPLVGG